MFSKSQSLPPSVCCGKVLVHIPPSLERRPLRKPASYPSPGGGLLGIPWAHTSTLLHRPLYLPVPFPETNGNPEAESQAPDGAVVPVSGAARAALCGLAGEAGTDHCPGQGDI